MQGRRFLVRVAGKLRGLGRSLVEGARNMCRSLSLEGADQVGFARSSLPPASQAVTFCPCAVSWLFAHVQRTIADVRTKVRELQAAADPSAAATAGMHMQAAPTSLPTCSFAVMLHAYTAHQCCAM